MLRTVQTTSSRSLHSSVPAPAILARKFPKPISQPKQLRRNEEQIRFEIAQEEEQPVIKRNEVGVQLLSRKLHRQLFRNAKIPAPPRPFGRIAQDHLKAHGLDPAQGSVLPDIGFTLPPLQGSNLDEHFYRIGKAAGEPWFSLAMDLSTAQLPPKPSQWRVRSGWTRYRCLPDGTYRNEPVDFPEFDGKPEDALIFDVETLPEYTQWAIMATAVSKNTWYSWVSPWLLGELDDPQRLIPLGDTTVPRVVVGHNVSFDRKRIMEEYNVGGTKTRFLDTMSLHISVKGISSHQRPAWKKYRKGKEIASAERAVEIAKVYELLEQAEEWLAVEPDPARKADIRRLVGELEDSLPVLESVEPHVVDDDGGDEFAEKRWEDQASGNSLVDVARLHCGIQLDKETRNDFLTCTPDEIRANIEGYLEYCSSDVEVTHAVFAKVLPAFLQACPSPVSFAGILTMGSSLLPVNEEWETYLKTAEGKYRELDEKIRTRLINLANEAKDMMQSEKWRDDVWLSQLDWTPKVAGPSRGVIPREVLEAETEAECDSTPAHAQGSQPETEPHPAVPTAASKPAWYSAIVKDPFQSSVVNRILPNLLQLSYDGHPMQYNTSVGWHYVVDGELMVLPTSCGKKAVGVLNKQHGVPGFAQGHMSSLDDALALAIASGFKDTSADSAKEAILRYAESVLQTSPEDIDRSPWLSALDWKIPGAKAGLGAAPRRKEKAPKPPPVYWPKWYWDISAPRKNYAPGTLDLTVRNRYAPLLLRLSWQGWPLVRSREHGWTFRVPRKADFQTRAAELSFSDPADAGLHLQTAHYVFYKLPHKDGEEANVGNPLAKPFMKYAQDGTLASPFAEAMDALDMNAQCSYWISSRDRIMKQMVVWQNSARDLGIPKPEQPDKKWGVILPQVITMGTVTRRAIERTWLTASNAKANRVGSELKAMVRAPPGYAIVGADVDSEELWISSVMGDAQFGLHGATAIGWMTLEGTKKAGTDLHSKTASILGISRDNAKVFNYSRIYGAGMRHAVLLLLQNSAGMLPEEAQKLATNLYASTKGKNTHGSHLFGHKFWYGGSESLVFNKLEEIALSDRPQTPALDCGITNALSKAYLPKTFGENYMTSRINWVVQSSGVDYLHLLIVSMQHLIEKYDIRARYLISVHDELRYLVVEEDRHRAALALQIANLWTRALFAYRLGLSDLPQGVAFFSAVDVDHVLRKEVDMPCVTPSQPVPISPGESLDIAAILEHTHGGSLWRDGASMRERDGLSCNASLDGYKPPELLSHRASSAWWLKAQATDDLEEVKRLARSAEKITARSPAAPATSSGRKGATGIKRLKKVRALASVDQVDWTQTVEEFLSRALQK